MRAEQTKSKTLTTKAYNAKVKQRIGYSHSENAKTIDTIHVDFSLCHRFRKTSQEAL